MKLVKKVLLYVIFTTSHLHTVDSVITMFVQRYPNIKVPLAQEKLDTVSKKLQQPGYLLNKIVKSKRVETGVGGINTMYLGYVGFSDHNGQITFPRKQQKSSINLLITRKVQPVYIIAPDTVANWMLDKHETAEMYNFKLHQDSETKLYYIETKKVDLPDDNMISLDTIIFVANPKNVFVPEGATITHYSPNLILPTIYIKKHFDFSYNALYTLSIKQYFGQVHSEYKQEDENIAKILK